MKLSEWAHVAEITSAIAVAAGTVYSIQRFGPGFRLISALPVSNRNSSMKQSPHRHKSEGPN